MKQYRLIGHTADIRLQIEGSTLEELFSAAIEGMAEIIVPGVSKQQPTERVTIEVRAPDTTALLIDFMSDVLTEMHINNAVYFKTEFEYMTPNSLKAQVLGIPVESFDEDIKAVTYHEAEVKKNKQGNYETVIVFDI